MKITILTDRGNKQTIEVAGNAIKVELEGETGGELVTFDHFLSEWTATIHRSKSSRPMSQATLKNGKSHFKGLWYLKEGCFVEVVSLEEAYLLQEDGYRLVKVEVSANGFVESQKAWLSIRQIGQESKVKGNNFEWPILQGVKRA